MTAEGDLGAIASNPYEITKASEPWLKKNTVIVVDGSHQIHPGKSLAGMKIWCLFVSTCFFFVLAHFGYGAAQKGVPGASLLTPDSFPFSYGSNFLMYAYLVYILYRSYTFPSPKNMDVSDFSPWHFVNAEVWAKLMTDAAWYDKGLLLECKGEFRLRICSYAGFAVDSVMYCIICTTYAMMIFDIDMYVVCTRWMCMTYARIMYTHV